mmetsp:Transcript_34025/g.89606  ORF Transcript_34025/g.89606 Transcript_34025/m.89606 type:complete len:312 (-) Transcript_34025:155-1090(-)
MAQHRHEFFRAHLVDEGVEHNDALVLAEAVHVRVRVRRALRSVDNVELGQRELADAGQLVDRFLKGSFLERRVFIEERLNVDRKDSKEEDRETEHEGPDVEVEVGTAPFDNVQKREHDRPANRKGERERDKLVLDECADSRLVEAVPVLHHERRPVRPRRTKDLVDDSADSEPNQRNLDLVLRRVKAHGGSDLLRVVPQKWHGAKEEEGVVLALFVEALRHAEAKLVETVQLRLGRLRFKRLKHLPVLYLFLLLLVIALFLLGGDGWGGGSGLALLASKRVLVNFGDQRLEVGGHGGARGLDASMLAHVEV